MFVNSLFMIFTYFVHSAHTQESHTAMTPINRLTECQGLRKKQQQYVNNVKQSMYTGLTLFTVLYFFPNHFIQSCSVVMLIQEKEFTVDTGFCSVHLLTVHQSFLIALKPLAHCCRKRCLYVRSCNLLFKIK